MSTFASIDGGIRPAGTVSSGAFVVLLFLFKDLYVGEQHLFRYLRPVKPGLNSPEIPLESILGGEFFGIYSEAGKNTKVFFEKLLTSQMKMLLHIQSACKRRVLRL